jgi:hypothetical protein
MNLDLCFSPSAGWRVHLLQQPPDTILYLFFPMKSDQTFDDAKPDPDRMLIARNWSQQLLQALSTSILSLPLFYFFLFFFFILLKQSTWGLYLSWFISFSWVYRVRCEEIRHVCSTVLLGSTSGAHQYLDCDSRQHYMIRQEKGDTFFPRISIVKCSCIEGLWDVHVNADVT